MAIPKKYIIIIINNNNNNNNINNNNNNINDLYFKFVYSQNYPQTIKNKHN